MRRKGVLITLLFLWIYLVGMGILLYPAINNYYTSKRMEGSVESFFGTNPTESGTDSTEAMQAAPETEPSTPYPELLDMLEAYNRELYEDDQSKLSSLAATEQPGVLFSVSGQAGDVFGVLSIIRQGNENPKVDIYTYVTENTFDSYLYQLVEGKQKFIGQIMTSKSPVRSAEDIDETALSYAEIKALCSGNPHIKEKMDLDIEVQKLKLLRSNHMSQRYALEDQLIRKFPNEIASMHQWIDGLEADMALLKDKTQPNADGFCPMVIGGQTYTEKKAAGTAILDACNALTSADPVPLGSYRGLKLTLCFDSFEKLFKISMQGTLTYKVGLGTDVFGNIQRMDNLLESIPTRQLDYKEKLKNLEIQVEIAKQEVEKPFPREEELKEKSTRLDQLNILLNMDKRENEIVDGVPDEGEIQPQRESRGWDR